MGSKTSCSGGSRRRPARRARPSRRPSRKPPSRSSRSRPQATLPLGASRSPSGSRAGAVSLRLGDALTRQIARRYCPSSHPSQFIAGRAETDGAIHGIGQEAEEEGEEGEEAAQEACEGASPLGEEAPQGGAESRPQGC